MKRECKYYFQIILKKFPEISGNLPSAFRYLEQKPLSCLGDSAFIWSAFHQYDIRADFFDTIPGDYVIIPTAGNAEKTAGTGDYNSAEIAFRNFDLDIADKSQPLAGTDADDLLALKVSKFNGHEAFLLLGLIYVD